MTLPDPHVSRSHYSPDRRTALVLTGTGIDGACHAGALHALTEAGVRIDLVAGRGVGAVERLFAAIDGGARLWEKGGLWRRSLQQSLCPWRPALSPRRHRTGDRGGCCCVVPAVVLGLQPGRLPDRAPCRHCRARHRASGLPTAGGGCSAPCWLPGRCRRGCRSS